MQIIDNTPSSYAPALKETVRDLLACATAQRLKGIKTVFFETAAGATAATSRYSYQNGQATVHIELETIQRLASGFVPLEWRPWTLGRRAAHALSFALANHALRASRSDARLLEMEARRIQAELLKPWSERWIERIGVPSIVKRLVSRVVDRKLASITRKRP